MFLGQERKEEKRKREQNRDYKLLRTSIKTRVSVDYYAVGLEVSFNISFNMATKGSLFAIGDESVISMVNDVIHARFPLPKAGNFPALLHIHRRCVGVRKGNAPDVQRWTN